MADDTGGVTVRLWASARAAAGVDCVLVPVARPLSVAALAAEVVARAPSGGPDLARVLSVCSVLVGERPLGGADPAEVLVEAGATVEFLPPFAGG